MNKEAFITALARDPRLGTPERAGEALDAVLDAITRITAAGNVVGLHGWGDFIPVQRERVRKGPGGAEECAPYIRLIFNPRGQLRRIVNGEEPAPVLRGRP